MEVTRRGFLKATGLGTTIALGFDVSQANAEMRQFKIARTTETRSTCPYCAVSCGVIIHTLGDKAKNATAAVVHVEGDPEHPINRGTLCPKGAATYQLAVNPNRVTKVWYRAPGAKDWDKTKTLDWAMEQIAQRVKATRDATFRETADKDLDGNPLRDAKGNPTTKRVNHTLAIGSLGGATMDNEWNYVQAKLTRALGVVYLENQARI